MENRSLKDRILDWFDERYHIKEFLDEEVFEKPAPGHLTWLNCFGGISLSIFIFQVLTGMMLMTYYRPTVKEAYKSVQYIRNNIPDGWFIQHMHSVGATLMIITVFIHMAKVFQIQAYKKPRELHWVSGVFLLLFTLTMSLTGYLLPWSQLSYWAATVATEVPRNIPFVGDFIVELIRGGDTITGVTLTRFYAIHVVILPLTLSIFMGLHFLMIRRTGISTPI